MSMTQFLDEMFGGPGGGFNDAGYTMTAPGLLTQFMQWLAAEKEKKSVPPESSWLMDLLTPSIPAHREAVKSRDRRMESEAKSRPKNAELIVGEFPDPTRKRTTTPRRDRYVTEVLK